MSRARTRQQICDELQQRLRSELPIDRVEVHPRANPCAILRPDTGRELALITRVTRDMGIPLRCAGTDPPKRRSYARLDLSRLSRIRDLDESSRLVLVQSGVNTGALESWLNVHRWTLGWFSPALEDLPICQVVQQGAAVFTRSFSGPMLDSIRGYRSILPDGSECWSRPGPLRATGPDLLPLYTRGFGFGLLTQLWIRIHPHPVQEAACSLRSDDLGYLVDVAQTEFRDSAPPRQALMVRERNSKGPGLGKWCLFLAWSAQNPRAESFEDRLRFQKGIKGAQIKEERADKIQALAPALGAQEIQCKAGLPAELQRALETTPEPWVLSFVNAHEIWIWSTPATAAPTTDKETVREWISEQQNLEKGCVQEIERALLCAIDNQQHFANHS